MQVSKPLEKLIKQIAVLPGLGPRSARRAVLQLLKSRETQGAALLETLKTVLEIVRPCTECANLSEQPVCEICTDQRRDRSSLCVVAEVDDLWAMERSRTFSGLYHVLGGVLAALDGVGPDDLRIRDLVLRLESLPQLTEVIMALPATVEGQTTAHYVRERLLAVRPQLNVTHLAHGIPMGGSLEYMDEGTLAEALRTRREYAES